MRLLTRKEIESVVGLVMAGWRTLGGGSRIAHLDSSLGLRA